jgi:hypothetical protein
MGAGARSSVGEHCHFSGGCVSGLCHEGICEVLILPHKDLISAPIKSYVIMGSRTTHPLDKSSKTLLECLFY